MRGQTFPFFQLRYLASILRLDHVSYAACRICDCRYRMRKSSFDDPDAISDANVVVLKGKNIVTAYRR